MSDEDDEGVNQFERQGDLYQSVFDLPDDEDDEDDEKEYLEDEEEMEEDSEKELDAWGSKKRAFYSKDKDVTIEEEEQEVLRLQKKRLISLKESDFMDPEVLNLMQGLSESDSEAEYEQKLQLEQGKKSQKNIVKKSQTLREVVTLTKKERELSRYKEKLIALLPTLHESFVDTPQPDIPKEAKDPSHMEKSWRSQKKGKGQSPLDYYEELERQQISKVAASKERRVYIPDRDPNLDLMPGEKRPINYAILKNKGLIPNRSKEQRNPRIKQKTRFEKASKRIKGARPVFQQGHPGKMAYSGERSGINMNVIKSKK